MLLQQIGRYKGRGSGALMAGFIRRFVYLLSTMGLAALALVLTGCVPGGTCC